MASVMSLALEMNLNEFTEAEHRLHFETSLDTEYKGTEPK